MERGVNFERGEGVTGILCLWNLRTGWSSEGGSLGVYLLSLLPLAKDIALE